MPELFDENQEIMKVHFQVTVQIGGRPGLRGAAQGIVCWAKSEALGEQREIGKIDRVVSIDITLPQVDRLKRMQFLDEREFD